MSHNTAMQSRDFWNGARYRAGASAGHYESWFLRANDASGQRAFWIRYTIFAPRGAPDAALGELWAIWFDRQAGRIVAVKREVPVSACRFSSERLAVAIDGAELDAEHLVGSAQAGGHEVQWSLRYRGGGEPLLLLPERLYAAPLPRAKALVAAPLARFSGTLTVDGEGFEVNDWVGSANHNWGSRHTDRYAWGQVAGFDEDATVFLECSTARLRLGPLWTPWMSPVVLRLGDETLRWNALPRAVRARGSYHPYEWTIDTRGPDGELAIRLWAEPKDFVALRYGNPSGGSKICLNSKVARCELALTRNGRTTVLHSARAAFEILEDTAPPGVTPVV